MGRLSEPPVRMHTPIARLDEAPVRMHTPIARLDEPPVRMRTPMAAALRTEGTFGVASLRGGHLRMCALKPAPRPVGVPV